MIGRTLSHFRVLSRIGEGGMGVVYRASDDRLHREVALKVLHSSRLADRERRRRVFREARSAAAVNHPNIASVYEIGEADGVVFIAMELIDGVTLRERLSRGPIPLAETLRLGAQVAEALACAHRNGVIHRDLKPDNVMVRRDGHAKILDFGLAKLAQGGPEAPVQDASRAATLSAAPSLAGTVFGTPPYMSPEQILGQPLDARTDVYSLGSTLYELIAGKPPFGSAGTSATLQAIVGGPPATFAEQGASVPPDLEALILQCLDKDPARRPASMEQVADRLQAMLRGDVGRPLPWMAAWLAHRRPRSRRAAAGLLAVGGLAAAALVWWAAAPAAPPPRRGDRVIVADFVNDTGDLALDSAVRDAFEHMLSGSTYLEVVRGGELRRLVKEATGTARASAAPNVARQLCLGGRCAGYFTGRCERVAGAVHISIALHAPDGARILRRSQSAPDTASTLAAVHDLTLGVRRDVGEAPGALACTPVPTTRSLLAYQAYALGESVKAGGMGVYYRADEALPLYRHALELDDRFVDAYRGAAWSLQLLGDRRGAVGLAVKASRLSSGLPDPDRLMSEILLLQVTYEYDTAIERLKSYVNLCPFDAGAHERLAWTYFLPLEEPAMAEKHSRASVDLQPVRGDARGVCYALAVQGKAEEIGRALDAGLTADQATVAECRVWKALAAEDFADAMTAIDALDRFGPPLSELAAYRRVVALLRFGRLDAARKAVAAAARQPVQIGWFFGKLWMAQHEAWLEWKRTGKPPSLPHWVEDYAASDLFRMRELARFSVDTGLAEPLASAIDRHAAEQSASRSRFVAEQLAFARACLAFVRGDAARARTLLEPLARSSESPGHHQVLGRVYEALGMWPQAAEEYELVLRSFYYYRINPAVWALDRYRLARVYERMGDAARAAVWYSRFADDWKSADPDIPEIRHAARRRDELRVLPRADAVRRDTAPEGEAR